MLQYKLIYLPNENVKINYSRINKINKIYIEQYLLVIKLKCTTYTRLNTVQLAT